MNKSLKYHRTKNGLISRMYSSQIFNSKKRNMEQPSYTKEEFIKWLLNTNFDILYINWINSDYNTNLRPSINRLEDLKSYSLDNIELITWEENRKIGHLDRKLGIGRSGLSRCKKVVQYDINMNYINEFNSQSIAAKETNSIQVSISKCCRKILNSTNGFIFRYKD